MVVLAISSEKDEFGMQILIASFGWLSCARTEPQHSSMFRNRSVPSQRAILLMVFRYLLIGRGYSGQLVDSRRLEISFDRFEKAMQRLNRNLFFDLFVFES